MLDLEKISDEPVEGMENSFRFQTISPETYTFVIHNLDKARFSHGVGNFGFWANLYNADVRIVGGAKEDVTDGVPVGRILFGQKLRLTTGAGLPAASYRQEALNNGAAPTNPNELAALINTVFAEGLTFRGLVDWKAEDGDAFVQSVIDEAGIRGEEDTPEKERQVAFDLVDQDRQNELRAEATLATTAADFPRDDSGTLVPVIKGVNAKPFIKRLYPKAA